MYHDNFHLNYAMSVSSAQTMRQIKYKTCKFTSPHYMYASLLNLKRRYVEPDESWFWIVQDMVSSIREILKWPQCESPTNKTKSAISNERITSYQLVKSIKPNGKQYLIKFGKFHVSGSSWFQKLETETIATSFINFESISIENVSTKAE